MLDADSVYLLPSESCTQLNSILWAPYSTYAIHAPCYRVKPKLCLLPILDSEFLHISTRKRATTPLRIAAGPIYLNRPRSIFRQPKLSSSMR